MDKSRNLTASELEANMTPEQLRERREVLAKCYIQPQEYIVSCSGILTVRPTTPEEWATAREDGTLFVDGATNFSPKF
jgi:hypothetical protein